MSIRHQDISRLRENLKELQAFRICTDSYEDLRDKLAIITVRILFRECFQEFGENAYRIIEHLEVFKRMNFDVKVTGLPSPYFYRAPQVPSWFLKEYLSMSEMARKNECCIWLYVKDNTENKILSSVEGELDEGYVLGYPDCCIKWYEEMWKKQTEVLYHYILRRYNTKDQYEIKEKLSNSNAENFAHLFLQISTDVNLEKTVKAFPFVFHIACEECVKNPNSPTALINTNNKHLASELNRDFHERIEDTSKEYASRINQRSASQKNDFCVLKEQCPWLSDLFKIADLGPF
jgi:hypothetical protein